MSHRIAVELPGRGYDIHVGGALIDRAPALLAPFVHGAAPIVTDRTVAPIHLDRLLTALRDAGIEACPIVLEPGEETKSFRGLEQLTDALLASGIRRDGIIVALGGGVVGDLTGFAAGVIKRGVAWAQIPTTLLAQVDSAVGGKTAINTSRGKNLLGLFHQPSIVIADTDLLRSLPPRQMAAGYAEVAKYGVMADGDFFAWLEAHASDALAGAAAPLDRMVAHACGIKAGVVSRDERESGERALLNLGHTFGHALEAATDFSSRLLHGEAVAIGMVLALRLSARLGHSPSSAVDRLLSHLRSVSLPGDIGDIAGPRPGVERLMGHMMQDKKARSGRLTFVLARGIGHAFLADDVPLELVRSILSE